eukprot:TRINITY_DN65205_c0_g1_i1.p1 TRINITY_DN65205_c0_g1~~TRINITY_DN65205_c0_g1_i1.p1  ORF type:complete len:557 (-),score=99.66 TRINITY_DN65205_c0_g1_i1:31-1461(-)
MLFHGIAELLKFFTLHLSEWGIVAFHYIHCSFYYLALQMVVAYEAGMIFENGYVTLDESKWTIGEGMRADYGRELTDAEELMVRSNQGKRSHLIDKYGNEIPVIKRNLALEQRQRRMKCFAGLLAHMTAFATIDAGGVLQHTEAFSQSPLTSLFPVCVTAVMSQVYFWLSDKYRRYHKLEALKAGRQGRRAKMCEAYVVDAENDITALSISFLLLQVIRFKLAGDLPDAEGIERPEKSHGVLYVATMYGFGTVLGFMAMSLAVVTSKCATAEGAEEGEDESCSLRVLKIIMSTCGMGFAWCILWGTRAMCVMNPIINLESMMGRVEFALILSIFSGVCVFLLDTIDDTLKLQGGSASNSFAIETIIDSLGLLVGFSWEQCFAHGVAVVSSTTRYVSLMKFVLGICTLSILVRPWRRYILTKVMYLEDYRKSILGPEAKQSSNPNSARNLARDELREGVEMRHRTSTNSLERQPTKG